MWQQRSKCKDPEGKGIARKPNYLLELEDEATLCEVKTLNSEGNEKERKNIELRSTSPVL